VLRHGMIMYDALYLWSREGREETHSWNPDLYRCGHHDERRVGPDRI